MSSPPLPQRHRTRHPRLRQTVLRPGVHVLRRSATELQVGLGADSAVVLPDEPAVRELLSSLAGPAQAPTRAYDTEALDLLERRGLVVDADALLPLLPAQGGQHDQDGQDGGDGRVGQVGQVGHSVLAAVARQAGPDTPQVLAARAGARVRLLSCGDPAAARLTGRLAELLDSCGVSPRRAVHGSRPAASDDDDLGVLVGVGEPVRERLDPWMRTETPHLVVRLVDGHALLGPFVRPGTSACLRCIDAHQADVDAAWPLLVAQHERACTAGRADTLTEPVDPALAALLAAWAAREVLTFLDGAAPPLTSATLRLDPWAAAVRRRHWAPHPACGCTWS